MNTEAVSWVGKPNHGYLINTAFSEDVAASLATIGQKFADEYGHAFAAAPASSLHITLLDWVSPLFDYAGQDKPTLYERVKESYDRELTRILNERGTIRVHFTEICVAPTTVYIQGFDDGQFKAIRDEFVSSTAMLEGSKPLPTIIHSSLGRFVGEVPMGDVEEFARSIPIDFYQDIEWFRLVHCTRGPMLEFEELKRYSLVD